MATQWQGVGARSSLIRNFGRPDDLKPHEYGFDFVVHMKILLGSPPCKKRRWADSHQS
jgi:hypothetical protein